mmetsp:Transcript_13865/g.37693  ORF Transcript_13865/g.37693 Transcript_13865/m.37693 type:complete len:223 (+) Transcript_13865:1560-2228(+)
MSAAFANRALLTDASMGCPLAFDVAKSRRLTSATRKASSTSVAAFATLSSTLESASVFVPAMAKASNTSGGADEKPSSREPRDASSPTALENTPELVSFSAKQATQEARSAVSMADARCESNAAQVASMRPVGNTVLIAKDASLGEDFSASSNTAVATALTIGAASTLTAASKTLARSGTGAPAKWGSMSRSNTLLLSARPGRGMRAAKPARSSSIPRFSVQ